MAARMPNPSVSLVNPNSGTPTPALFRVLKDIEGSLQTQIDAIAQAQADSAEAIAGVVELSGSLDGKQDRSVALDAITELSTPGFTVFTSDGSWAARSFADTATIGWTNPAGESGNPSAAFIGSTTNVPEGSNLYFTDARADARITAQKGVALGLATLDASAKLDGSQLPALAITETSVVASEAAMLALTAQEGDVAVRSDLSKSFILTASPATTLANWQELLTPTSAVSSVFGRTGAVTAQTGDYTAAQVGADPAGTAASLSTADRARVNHTGTQVMATISDLPTLASGTYTPTLTNVANIDASTAFACQYLRVGNSVTVSGAVNIDTTAATTATALGISLPVASNLASYVQCCGVATAQIANGSAIINGDTTNDRANLAFSQAGTSDNRAWYFTFTYLVM